MTKGKFILLSARLEEQLTVWSLIKAITNLFVILVSLHHRETLNNDKIMLLCDEK